MQASKGVSAATPSFLAFLSYSHADKAAAQRFHRKLESYRLPRHLKAAGTDSRIGKVFRDREDLPAATDLSASVRQALAASRTLIVLCSPNAKASHWVAREIALFRELHPGRQILAVLLHGEPDEAFPAPLHEGGEPLAADLRKDGDGYRLGFLKVVAGAVGVPLDALVQRDSQRQVRRVMAITGLSTAVALVMAVMTVIALQARSDAQRQQAAAEGLIEYMLTDLREDLGGAAGLAVMSRVNQRALAYYESEESLDTLSPESLERRGRAVGRLGEDALLRKDFALAKRNFDERVRTTSSLLEEDPRNPDRKFDHALSLNWLALLAEASGNREAAKAHLEGSWAILSDIKAWRRDEFEWQRANILVAGNLCAIDTLKHEVGDATLEKCHLAVTLGRALAAKDAQPSRSTYDLVFNLTWYSSALDQSGRGEDAAAMRREVLRLTDRLAAQNPSNRKIRAQRMETYGYLASFAAPQERRAMLETAIAIAQEMTRLDPARADWKESLRNLRKQLEK